MADTVRSDQGIIGAKSITLNTEDASDEVSSGEPILDAVMSVQLDRAIMEHVFELTLR